MLQPSITFDINSNSTDFGNIITTIQDVNFPATPVGYNVDVALQITGPTGSIFKAFSGVDVNVNSDAIFTVNTIAIPLTSNGEFQEGSYKFEFTYTPSSGTLPGDIFSFELDVKKQGVDNCVIKGNLDFDADCLSGQATIQDTTDYKDSEILLRQIVFNYPNIPNVTTPSPVSSNTDLLVAPIFYSNVSYSVSLDVLYQNSYLGGVITVIEDLTTIVSEKVICKHDLCKLLTCIHDFYTSFKTKAGDAGGIEATDQQQKDAFQLLTAYITMFQQYITCGDIKMATKYYDMILDIAGCDCGCSDQNGMVPKPITPIASSGNVAISGTPPIFVTSSGSSFNIFLDVNFVSTVNSALQDVIVDNPVDGTFLSVTTPVGNPNVRLISITMDPIKSTAWTTITDADTPAQFDFDIDSTLEPLRYKVNPFFSQLFIDGTFILKIPPSGVGQPICILATPTININASRNNIQIGVFDPNGEIVGTVSLIGAGTNRNLVFIPNGVFVSGRLLNVNGIINYD